MLHRLLYSPFLAQLVVTRRCNLACGYCTEFDKVSPPIPTPILKGRIDRLDELGTLALELTGGEPMLHPDICELIRYARREKGLHKVMMISNAYLFSEERVGRLNDAGLQELQISVDGVRPNAITVKVLEPLRRKLEVVARTARFPVVLNAVLGSTSADEALAVVEFAKAHGFRPRVLLIHDGDGQLDLGEEGRLGYRRLRRAIGRRFVEAGDYRSRLLAEGQAPFKCHSGSRYLYIDELGWVRWCSQTSAVWGRPLETYSAADLEEQFHTPKGCNALCTKGCARTCSALDEWRPQRGRRLPAPAVAT